MYVCINWRSIRCVRIYACIFVCMFVCRHVCLHVCMYTPIGAPLAAYVCMHVCLYVCLFVRMHVSLYAHIQVALHSLCMYIYMYVCMHVCMYVCMHVCTNWRSIGSIRTYAGIFVCMFVCTYVCVYQLALYWQCPEEWRGCYCQSLPALTTEFVNSLVQRRHLVGTCVSLLCVKCYTIRESSESISQFPLKMQDPRNPPNRATQIPRYLAIHIQIEILIFNEKSESQDSVDVGGCSIFSGICHTLKYECTSELLWKGPIVSPQAHVIWARCVRSTCQ